MLTLLIYNSGTTESPRNNVGAKVSLAGFGMTRFDLIAQIHQPRCMGYTSLSYTHLVIRWHLKRVTFDVEFILLYSFTCFLTLSYRRWSESMRTGTQEVISTSLTNSYGIAIAPSPAVLYPTILCFLRTSTVRPCSIFSHYPVSHISSLSPHLFTPYLLFWLYQQITRAPHGRNVYIMFSHYKKVSEYRDITYNL